MSELLTRKIETQAQSGSRPYRVMVVDDSAVIRGFISRWLEEDPQIAVVSTASHGRMALRALRSSNAEVVILDIEMPVMDGMEALPLLIREVPDIKIIMASTLTKRNADISLRALQAGASDYVPKPESKGQVNSSQDFRREIIEKIKALAATRRKARGELLPLAPASGQDSGASAAVQAAVPQRDGPIVLAKPSAEKPAIMAVGASTGGPQAVCTLLGDMKHFLNIPTLVAQHMPATFTGILAVHLARATGRACQEAEDGQLIGPDTFVVAPGDYHMTVERDGADHRIRLNQEKPEHFCRPSVNPMLRSLAESYGRHCLGVILTGMGADGVEGAADLVKSGGTIVGQDEATSVVWGMPGAVAKAGLCSAVLPLPDLGPTLSRYIMGGKL